MSEQITDVEIATWVAKSLGYSVVEKHDEPVAEIEVEVESEVIKSDEEIVETEPEVESEIVKSDDEAVEPEVEAEIEPDAEVEKSVNGLEADHPLFVPAGMDVRGDNGLEEGHPLYMKKSETDTFLA